MLSVKNLVPAEEFFWNHRHRAPQAPSSSPTVTASAKPVKMRSALNPTLCQKSAVGSSRHKVCTVCRGVAKNKSL